MNDSLPDRQVVTPDAVPVVPFAEALGVWAKIGLINFGGPAGQIALMHRILVEEKRWIDEPRFLHALNYCMLLPGPEAQQLATYVGWLMHGTRGGLAAGTLFVLPGFFVLLGLSAAYFTFGELAFVQGLLFGLKAAVVAIVAEALVRMSRRALKDAASVGIAIAAFVALAFLDVPFPVVVAGAGLVGLALSFVRPASAPAEGSVTADGRPPWGAAAKAALVWSGIWLIPVGLLVATFGRGHVFADVALFFSKVAVVTFGGAYAVLAYVAQQAVDAYRWLRPDEMLTGLGLAETTPGPLILVLVFVGFLAGARAATGLDPLLAGAIAATVTLFVTFAPSFLFIFAGAPFLERLRGNRALAGTLSAITSAVVGVIASLALWFTLHVLFAEITEHRLGPLVFTVPDPSSFEATAALVALVAGLALLRFRVGVVTVLVAAAVAGIALRLAA